MSPVGPASLLSSAFSRGLLLDVLPHPMAPFQEPALPGLPAGPRICLRGFA